MLVTISQLKEQLEIGSIILFILFLLKKSFKPQERFIIFMIIVDKLNERSIFDANYH